MEKAGWRTFTCPRACENDDVMAMLLPQRQLFLCLCKQCRTMWLDGPRGSSIVSADELLALQRMRTQYARGELVG